MIDALNQNVNLGGPVIFSKIVVGNTHWFSDLYISSGVHIMTKPSVNVITYSPEQAIKHGTPFL